jgi:hypothetical protein
MRQTLPTVNKKHLFRNILCVESFCSQKTQNRTLLFGSKLLKHGRQFDYWNQPLNTRMRVCYLHCHETRLCCYLVIHMANILRLLQLFYFHLRPIYWLPRISYLHISYWKSCLSAQQSPFVFAGSRIQILALRLHWDFSWFSKVSPYNVGTVV